MEIIIFFSCGLFYDTQKTCGKLKKQKNDARAKIGKCETWRCAEHLVVEYDSKRVRVSAIYKFPVSILRTTGEKYSYPVSILSMFSTIIVAAPIATVCDYIWLDWMGNAHTHTHTNSTYLSENHPHHSLETVFPNKAAPTNKVDDKIDGINAASRRFSSKVSRFTWTSADAVFHRAS